MDLNQILLVLVIVSLGLLLVNFLKPKILTGLAGALICASIIWHLWLVIGSSSDATQSNPLWLAVYAFVLIGAAQLLTSLFGKRK